MILFTTDGGFTWAREYPPTKQNLHSIAMVDPFHVYICGDSGTILWTQAGGYTGGVRSEGGDLSMNVQSYPNPITVKTTIQVFLKQDLPLNLKIFNALGVEVAAIANGRYGQGQHNFEWNASEVPNGMYLCSLESEGRRIYLELIVAK